MAPFVYDAEHYDVYIGNDVDKRSFALNIRERYHQIMTKTIPASYGRQKAIVAVAHKLTLRIYRVLTERRAYVVR